MYIPDEFDEEARLRDLLGYTSMDEVRSIIYRICYKFPKQTIDAFLKCFDQTVNLGADPTLSTKIRAIWMNSVANAKLKPGGWEILDDLRNAGMKLALISNTPPTSHYIVDRLKLRERFDVVVFSCDARYLKPDPRIFQIALDALNISPKDSIVVGDKIRTDILGGAILGMRSVLLEERCHEIIENGQNYVDVIIPRLLSLWDTKLYKESVQ